MGYIPYGLNLFDLERALNEVDPDGALYAGEGEMLKAFEYLLIRSSIQARGDLAEKLAEACRLMVRGKWVSATQAAKRTLAEWDALKGVK